MVACCALGLHYALDATHEERGEIYDKTYRLLDSWPEDWEFYLYDYDHFTEKVSAKAPGSCVFDRQKNK